MSVPKSAEALGQPIETTFHAVRLGNLVDPHVTSSPGAIGVPMNVVPHAFYLDSPRVADADFFVDGHASTATGNVPLLQTSMQTNAATGRPFARNLTMVLSGAITAVDAEVTVVGKDALGNTRTETFTTNGVTAVAGNIAFATITSINVDVANDNARTLDVGFGVKMGLPYPCYSGILLGVRRDNEGDSWPAEADSGTIVAGAPDVTDAAVAASADWNGTITFQNAPDTADKYVVAYLADYTFAPGNTYGGYPAGAWPTTNT